jgi:transcriptional regulator with XRE-family HTH domain
VAVPADLDSIGTRLREERERHGISQRELSRRLGVSPSLISQIESGQSRPSVSTLYAIVTELGASLEQVFRGHEADDGSTLRRVTTAPANSDGDQGDQLVHPSERDVIELASGVRWERLTGRDENVDFLHVIYDVGGSSSPDERLMRHAGREYGYVISGRLGVQIGFKRYELGPGDTIAFDSSHPHRLWNLGDEQVHGIWFVMGRYREVTGGVPAAGPPTTDSRK